MCFRIVYEIFPTSVFPHADLLLPGFGCMLANICCMATISRVVSGSRQALYLSICITATGINQLFYPFVFEEWTQQYGLNGTWLLTGALMLNVWALPIVLYTNQDTGKTVTIEQNVNVLEDHKSKVVDIKSERNGIYTVTKEKNNDTDLSEHPSALKASTPSLKAIVIKEPANEKCVSKHGCINIPLIGILLGTGITMGASNAFLALLLDIFKWKGYSVDQSLKVFIPISLFNILSRIVTGLIKQRRGINSLVYPMLVIVCAIVGQTLMLYLDNFAVLCIAATLNAILNGGIISTAYVLVVKLSKERSTVLIGLLSTMTGITSAAFSPLFGKYFDDLCNIVFY